MAARRLGLFLTLLACAVWGSQEAGADEQHRTALVIGNSRYATAPLSNPTNDARSMARALRSLDFLVIERTNLDQRGMKKAMNEFGERLRRRRGVGLFFFAGHGIQVDGENYLIPIGAKIESESDVDIEGVRAARILAKMERAGNDLNLVILDACRNNPFARSFRSASRGLAVMNAPTGSLVAYSTSPGSVAADGSGKNSYYTEGLVRAMTTRDIPIEEVFKRARNYVLKATGDAQTPWESTSIRGSFYLAGGPPERTTGLVEPQVKIVPRPRPPAQARAPSRFEPRGTLVWDAKQKLWWYAGKGRQTYTYLEAQSKIRDLRVGGKRWRLATKAQVEALDGENFEQWLQSFDGRVMAGAGLRYWLDGPPSWGRARAVRFAGDAVEEIDRFATSSKMRLLAVAEE